VLRILRAGGEPLACGEIASRLITREPDITRCSTGWKQRGLVSRSRQSEDRRVVRVSITDGGGRSLEGPGPQSAGGAPQAVRAHERGGVAASSIALLEKGAGGGRQEDELNGLRASLAGARV
jgi:DNA-binding MarR family transcriptional regulator